MKDEVENNLAAFLEAEFHQDIDDPEAALYEFINDAGQDYLGFLSKNIQTFLASELSNFEKEQFIINHTCIYYPAIGLSPTEWLKMVLSEITNHLNKMVIKWSCQYHIILLPNYQKKIIYGHFRNNMKEVLIALCERANIQIIKVSVLSDHVHLFIKFPPEISVSEVVGYLKGESVLMMYKIFPEILEKVKGDFWLDDYYVTTFGEANEEEMREFIADHRKK